MTESVQSNKTLQAR